MSAPTETSAPVKAARAADDPTTQEWQRLSPRMLAVHPIQELLRGSPALIALLLLGHGKANGDYWSLAALVIVLALGVMRWLTTTYRITPRHVQVRRGILKRSVLSAPRDRIRSVDLTSHWLHRLLGLARVTVGTGTSDRKGDGGLKLDALSVEQAEELREQLLHGASAPVVAPRPTAAATTTPATSVAVPIEGGKAGKTTGAVKTPAAKPIPATDSGLLATWSPSWIRYGPLSLSGIVTVLVIFAFGSQIVSAGHIHLSHFGPLRALGHQLHHAPVLLAVLEVVVLAAIAVGLASTARYVLRFWNFRLTRTGRGTLHISHGLVSTRSTTVEERRLRGVEISQTLLLRLAGAARCVAITTGLKVGRGAERGGSLLLPPAPIAVAREVAGAVLGDAAPMTAPVTRHGTRAHRRRYTRALGFAVLVTGLLLLLHATAGLPNLAWQLSLVLFPVNLLLAADRYRNLGHALVDGWLVSARGSLVRRRSAISGDGIIGWKMRRTFFQRRAGLVTLTATTAAGRQGYPVQDVELVAGVALANAVTPDLLRPFLAEP